LDLEGTVSLPAAVILAFLGVAAQQPPPPAARAPQQPPRDAVGRAEPTGPVGTGVIRGRVVASDTGSPIRRANVSLLPMPTAGGRGAAGTPAAAVLQSPGAGPSAQVSVAASFSQLRPQQATTDSQGNFEFKGVAAGTYRISVSPNQAAPQYLGVAYGAKRPNAPGWASDLGQAIQLADGQTFDKAVVALPRGGVITGRVTDENADPAVRVQVYTLFFPPGSARGMRMGPGSQTDDLGQFRIYGLQPGDHAVVAEPIRFNFGGPNAPETEDDRIGFVTTYYPGTADEESAQRVRVRVATETPGIEIRLAQSRLYRISGSVVDSQGRPLPHVSGQAMRRTAASTGWGSFGFSTDEQGRFQMRNVPSGNYRLIIRQTRPYTPGPQTDPGEMASVPLTIAGADVDDVLVMTTPGITISGRVVFEQGPPATPPQVRVIAIPGSAEDRSGLPPPQSVVVTPDGTFTMKGLLGEFMLRASARDQYLKSVAVGSEEVTDTAREFKATDRVTITLTTRVSTLEGDVTDGAGAAPAEAGVLLFSEDKGSWRFNSTRTRRAGVDAAGHFRMTGLMPGRYLVVALPRERLNMPPGPDEAAFFETLAKDAVSLVLAEDEQRKVDLKVVSGQ
jgi:hypothetical protein